MGLTITGNYKKAVDLTGGYGMMIKIRNIVSLAFDEEFGKHYATLLYSNIDEFNKKANAILKHERFKDEDEDILDFLYAPDCDGKVNYKTCGKIYNLIKDIEKPNLCLRYAVDYNNDWEDFKKLLKECYSHRANMIWY